MPLYPIGHLLHEATLPRHGGKAALPSTQKQTQEGCQNKETKKHGDKQSIRFRMLKEFIGYCNSRKKT